MLPTVGEEEKDEGLVESLGHVDPEAVRLVHSLQPVGSAPLKLKLLEGFKVFENYFISKCCFKHRKDPDRVSKMLRSNSDPNGTGSDPQHCDN